MRGVRQWAKERRYLLTITGVCLFCTILGAGAASLVFRHYDSALNDLAIVLFGSICGWASFSFGARICAKQLDQELHYLITLEEGEE